MPEHELLIDPFHCVYAVNCKVEDATLHCGALYVEAGHRHQLIRLSDKSARLDVQLPDELLDQPTPKRGWNVDLPIVTNHEQVQHPLRS